MNDKVMEEGKREKMSKPERLIKFRQLLESYKKAGQEPEVTEMAKYLNCTRQTLYYDEDYRALLEEYEIGKKFKKKTIASEEYLLDRIEALKQELTSKDNAIKKLYAKIANLEKINQEAEEESAKEKRTSLRLQIYYLHLIETYNKSTNRPIHIEPFDIHKLNIDPLDLLLKKEEINASYSNITVLNPRK
ncbi:MAG TPA: hypothetical protein VM577_17945 [Anaerovoracaceae bacterium]|nr:hypothetical protein [Anaerovoracaceae bacterium]